MEKKPKDLDEPVGPMTPRRSWKHTCSWIQAHVVGFRQRARVVELSGSGRREFPTGRVRADHEEGAPNILSYVSPKTEQSMNLHGSMNLWRADAFVRDDGLLGFGLRACNSTMQKLARCAKIPCVNSGRLEPLDVTEHGRSESMGKKQEPAMEETRGFLKKTTRNFETAENQPGRGPRTSRREFQEQFEEDVDFSELPGVSSSSPGASSSSAVVAPSLKGMRKVCRGGFP